MPSVLPRPTSSDSKALRGREPAPGRRGLRRRGAPSSAQPIAETSALSHCLSRCALLARACLLACLLFGSLPAEFAGATPAPPQEDTRPQPARPADAPMATVQEIAEQTRKSLVVIHGSGRDRGDRGVGTGFIIDARGLIATNLHVIGEAREFRVEDSQGNNLPVKAILASDRFYDLAVVEVTPLPDRPLTALKLAPPRSLPDGAPIVVMGNPLGLKHSVVSGVLSGARQLEGRDMLQLAIPVEPGNSGGPVLDMQGRVHGVVTMKSLLTENLGFALRIDALHRLIDQPNPVPLANWIRLGGVDPERWLTKFGAHWQEKGGRLVVTGAGQGFGGRSLCLQTQDPPELPYEVGVSVKLNDEAGAAGLVFHSDGGDRHYGFYPSNGALRLSCFEGPTVYSWKVLHNQPSTHYRPGQWNHLKVRVEAEQLLCYVNDQLVVTSRDKTFTSGKIGLAKFRTTEAEFRHFEVGPKIASRQLDGAVRDQLAEAVQSLGQLATLQQSSLKGLRASPGASASVLRAEAELLQQRAGELKKIAQDVVTQSIASQLETLCQLPDEKVDLLRGALLIAQLDNEEMELAPYLETVDRIAAQVRRGLPAAADDDARRAALDRHLFIENGYHGSRAEYYHPANSHLNRVIDDREGLPITLSVLYMELARRLNLTAEGVGLPGHFVVRISRGGGEPALVDVFNSGKVLTREDAERIVKEHSGEPLRDEHLLPAGKVEILQRMLRNLLGVAQRSDDKEAMLRYLESMVAVAPDSVADRGMRAVVRFETGRKAAAVDDLDWILGREPAGVDLERIREMRDYFRRSQ